MRQAATRKPQTLSSNLARSASVQLDSIRQRSNATAFGAKFIASFISSNQPCQLCWSRSSSGRIRPRPFRAFPSAGSSNPTVAWLGRCRRLAKDWERVKPQSARLPSPRFHPPHAAKTMQYHMKFPDRLLGQKELSKLAGVGISTLKRIELANEITGSAQTLWKIQTAPEKAGALFIPADDSMGPCVA
jgi:hypothetical protein